MQHGLQISCRAAARKCVLSALSVPLCSPAFAQDLGFQPFTGYDLEYSEPNALQAADFDEDGNLDLAVTVGGATYDPDGASITLLLGNGAGAFPDNPAHYEPPYLKGLAVADFDRDGHQDLAYARIQSTSALVVALGDGTGAFQASAALPLATGALAASDFDRDGDPDLVCELGLRVLLGAGDGSFTVGPQNTAIDVSDLVVTDMNADQNPDVVIGTHQGWVIVFLGDGAGHLTQAGASGGGASYLQRCRLDVGDFNDDAIPDVAWVPDSPYQLRIALGTGGGGLAPHQVIDTYGSSPYDIAVADFDADGRDDLAVTQVWSTLHVYAGAGNGTFAAPLNLATGFEPQILDAIDVNADGLPDLLSTCRNGGDTPLVAVHLNAGVDTTPPVLTCPAGVSAIASKEAPQGAFVSFSVTATDLVDPSPTVVCTPPSGSFFPRGTTVVLCSATDASGNRSTCTFEVVVQPTLRRR